jgi:hypothetical protein
MFLCFVAGRGRERSLEEAVMTKLFFVVLILVVFGALTFAASEEQVGNSWLNGKWEGRPPAGGELRMTLSVEKDNQIRGTAVIPGGRRRDAHPEVTGTVNGNRVTLDTFFPSAFPQSVVHYDCTLTNDALQCRTKSGYKTTFNKVK